MTLKTIQSVLKHIIRMVHFMILSNYIVASSVQSDQNEVYLATEWAKHLGWDYSDWFGCFSYGMDFKQAQEDFVVLPHGHILLCVICLSSDILRMCITYSVFVDSFCFFTNSHHYKDRLLKTLSSVCLSIYILSLTECVSCQFSVGA